MIRYRLICQTDSANSASKTAPREGSATARAGKTSPKKPAASGCGGEFESWFQGSDAFESLQKAGQISCPACGSHRIERALMAPSVKTSKGKERTPRSSRLASDAGQDRAASATGTRTLATLTPEQRAFVDTMRKVREHVLSNSENVGKRFVEEARKIHHEETETRSIHGEASLDEAKSLAEEGIDIFPIPVLPDDRN